MSAHYTYGPGFVHDTTINNFIHPTLNIQCFYQDCFPFETGLVLSLFLMMFTVSYLGNALNSEPSNGCWGQCRLKANDVHCTNIWPQADWWKRGSFLPAPYQRRRGGSSEATSWHIKTPEAAFWFPVCWYTQFNWSRINILCPRIQIYVGLLSSP